VSVISLLQLATRAGISRQSEIQGDYWVAPSSLHLCWSSWCRSSQPSVLPSGALITGDTRYLLIRKRRHHNYESCAQEIAMSRLQTAR